jgi:hypothetical protein
MLRPLIIIIASSTEIAAPEIFPVCEACLCADTGEKSGNYNRKNSYPLVLDPGKGVCADPVNGGAILGKGGTGSPRRGQGASVESRQGKREDVIG